ncbi:MAG: iodotyrosine deiodinase [Urechidicola sp.]|jgi:nitroreductase|tara:strand:+ start:5109 stop:5801 length:693 start_codon:yes stop_codon:yes gene_type:complete
MANEKYKIIDGHKHILYSDYLKVKNIEEKSESFFQEMDWRRSVRDFSDKPVPKSVIENIIKTASTAPSGAHKQPWFFCVIESAELKSQIRKAAEEEERKSYEGRMSKEWLNDLKPLGTNHSKPFLEIAPYLIIVFKKPYDLSKEEEKLQNYYVNESVGIACGMLITAIHQAGLVTLTHTPSPMNFLTKLLERPSNERAFLLLPVGYPVTEAYVPDIERKNLDEVSKFYSK